MDTSGSFLKYRSAVLSALIFISTYLVIRTGIECDTSSGTILSTLALMACCLLYLWFTGVSIARRAIPLLFTSFAFVISVFLNGNLLIRKISLVVSILLFLLALFKGTDRSGTASADPVPAELIRCFFYGIDTERIAASAGRRQDRKWAEKIMPVLLRIILGLMLCAPVFIFVLLMLSYDSAFGDLLSDIFSFDIEKIVREFIFIIYSVPLFAYLVLSISSFASGNGKKRFDDGTFSRMRASTNWFSPVTVISMVLPVLILYVIFFISQWDYYTLAFLGYVPEGYSYAEYAREGFFQLCAVSVVNFLMMLGCTWFSDIKEVRSRFILKIVTVTISVCSLILIATAASKMYLYIKQYGLTPLRVYSSWGMAVLTAVFILFTVKQFSPRLPVYSLCIMCSVVLLLALCISDPDTRIAEYNTDQFIKGGLQEVDITLLHSLGDSATPSLIRLSDYYRSLSEADKTILIKEHGFRPWDIEVESLRSYYINGDSPIGKWYSVTLPYLRAKTSVTG